MGDGPNDQSEGANTEAAANELRHDQARLGDHADRKQRLGANAGRGKRQPAAQAPLLALEIKECKGGLVDPWQVHISWG